MVLRCHSPDVHSRLLSCSILQYDACDGHFIKQFAFVPGQPRGLKFHTLPSAHTPPRQQKMLLVASAYSDSILKFNGLTGSPIGTFATGVDTPWDLVIGPANNGANSNDIFVTSEHEDAVIQFHATTGAFKSKFTDKKVAATPPHPERTRVVVF